jgi:hypothetical protein
MSKLHRGSFKDAPYQLSIHLAKRFQRRNFLPTWPPQAILVYDWLISKKNFFSETALPNESIIGREHP